MTKPVSRTPSRRVGSIPRVPTEDVQKLFNDAALSKADFAVLAGAGISRKRRGGYQSTTVDFWLSGERLMSADTYEVVLTRLWLLKNHHASFSELVTQPLKDIIAKLME